MLRQVKWCYGVYALFHPKYELIHLFAYSRVKQAIMKKEEVVTNMKQQYQAAVKRADHLEGLLDQQRKQLLSVKK